MYTDYQAEAFFPPHPNRMQAGVAANDAGIPHAAQGYRAASDALASIHPHPVFAWLADNLTPTPVLLAK